MEFIHRAHQQDTIGALATPPGLGGIAIIRISGKEAIATSSRIVKKPLHEQPSHTASLGIIYNQEGKKIDQALILVMRAPKSFTGEETVEIHCHGGNLIAKKILEELFSLGVRPALPGEFSQRAFLNGKLDLAQAEAIQSLIGAQNEEALRVAEEQLEGRLSKAILSFQQKGATFAAIFEAWVDFPEEGLEFRPFDEVLQELQELEQEVSKLLKTFHHGKILQQGISLCILGAPNVGKSSLMNALLGKDRAIVSHIAGTTRDVVEDDLFLHGLHMRLIDTAGLRETEELIEEEGVRRSRQAMSRADIVMCVLDASRKDDPEMLQPLKELPEKRSLIVWNKVDLGVPSPLKHPHVVHVSALTKEGLETLTREIHNIVWEKGTPKKDEVMITNLRHKEALERALESIQAVIQGLQNGVSPEFIAFDMQTFLKSLGTIIGTNITEDILNSIFSQFCVGK